MHNVQQELEDLTLAAKDLHCKERQINLESVLLIGKLEARNAAARTGMNTADFAIHIGLTPSQYWKRAQAARVIQFFPQTLDMLKRGETQVSHLALLAPKITGANVNILLPAICHQSTREVQGLLSRVTRDGRLLEKEATFDLHLTLSQSQLERLDRAREVMAHGGHVPATVDIFFATLDCWLERRDPLRKAERAERRRRKAETQLASATQEHASLEATDVGGSASATKRFAEEKSAETIRAEDHKEPCGDDSATKRKQDSSLINASMPKGARSQTRPAIPAAVRHRVWLRDGGQCTWRNADGSRCTEQMMLELDHQTMHCRGGEDSVENLALRCRYHNIHGARLALGDDFMAKFAISRQ